MFREIVTRLYRAWGIALFTLFFIPLSFAQIVYQCDFEDMTEREKWVLNVGPRAELCLNKWYIGEAVNATRDGAYGLFVSNNGIAATYTGNFNCISVAVRELELEEGDYTLFFDWMAKGKAASGEGIWMCWVPDTVDTYSARTLRPLWVDQYRIDSVFNSSSIWKQGKLTFHTDGGKHKLAIAWTNTGGSYTVPPSGCVDNIVIIPKEDECPPPSDFTRTMNGTTMRISWQGEADWYDARVYDFQAQTWQYFDSVTLKRIDIDGLSEGMAQVFVRSHCGKGGISQYVLYTPFYFLPGRCINYLGIDDRTQCTPFIGTATQPRGIAMLVDSGYASIASRHTLHYVPGETDPRTDNMLKTKPDDALASVRLGNWNYGAEGECIEYTYDVPDGDVAILKLRYAIVLNQPSTPHDEATQSSFKLDIFYGDRNRPNQRTPLPGGCGSASFHVGYGDQTGWHPVGNGEVMWKEWTEVAVNLREYVGKRITVSLSTADCTAGGHYSYAYFTLDCESGELSGLNCGEDNPTTSFEAPSGFNYAWYLPDNPSNILSTEQKFTIEPMDTLTYNVDVISQTNSRCYYTLDACGIPRYPVAKAEYKWNGGEHCENVVTFYNQSYIYYKNIERWNQDHRSDTVYTNNEKVQETIWDFGDGEIVVSNADSIVHVYPAVGGVFSPSISVSISDGACTVSKPIGTLELPDVSVEEKEKHISKGSMYNGRVYWEPSVFDDIVVEDGCETLYHIHVHETEFKVDTSFCEGGYFQLGDQRLDKSGTYKATLKSRQWPEVDSIVTLTLRVDPALIIQTADTFVVCADAPFVDIPIMRKQGTLDSVYIQFTDSRARQFFQSKYAFGEAPKIELEVPANIRADYYPAVLQAGSARCPAPEKDIVIQVNYPGSVLMQQYGFIAMQDTAHNGGYAFTNYTWYRNGELMPDETKSYIIVDPDEDMYAEFTVVPTRTDGLVLPVCPVIYTGTMAIEEVQVTSSADVHPRLVSAGEMVRVKSESEWMMVDVFGRVVAALSNASEIQAPSQSGVYMLVFPYAHEVVRIIVK